MRWSMGLQRVGHNWGLNWTELKEAKHLYLENYKTMIKKLVTTQTNGKIYHVRGLEELKLLKWPYYPRCATASVQFLTKYQWHFHRIRTNVHKICMKTQKAPNMQIYLKKVEQTWKYHTPLFQTVLWSYSQECNMVLAHKQIHRLMEQNQSPEMSSHLYGQWIYNIGGKNIQ